MRRDGLFATSINVRLSLGLFLILAAIGCNGGQDNRGNDQAAASATAASGRIEAGLRVLTLDPGASGSQDFTIYRGDYVRIESTSGEPVTIAVPELAVNKTYPVSADEKAYFKVPRAGVFPYTANNLTGVIKAIDFVAHGYREVQATEGAELIANVEPFILDVRTPGEYSQGHLADSHLVPVQILQNEIENLPVAKDRQVFVYCRSGNRSTVAAKMLVDHGFTKVVDLRGGIKAWVGAGLPTTK